MKILAVVLVFCLGVLVSCQLAEEKRSAMGGSAFGSLDRIPLSMLRKYYAQSRQQEKRALRAGQIGYGRSFYMG